MQYRHQPRTTAGMRTVLAALAICLCACGGGSHHAAPVDHTFDRLAGTWSATCTVSSGTDYTAYHVGDVVSFTVDRSGHLVGFFDGTRDVTMTVTNDAPNRFFGQRTRTNGHVESLDISLTPTVATDTASFTDIAGGTSWTLTPISAPG